MSDANYRCRSCKTRVTMTMSICPICGEPITPQTALLGAGSGAPVKVVMRHVATTVFEDAVVVTPAQKMPQVVPQTWAEMVDEMTTTPNMAAYAYPVSTAKTRMAGRSFAMYVACVVMVLVGSFLIGIGLARRYTASEQAAQNSAAPAKVIVVQPSAGVGGPLTTQVADKTK